jgi:hypothetical protein
MKLKDIPVGGWFVFANREPVVNDPFAGAYEHIGSGWYGRPYTGGPNHADNDSEVHRCDLGWEQNCRAHAQHILDDEDARWRRNAEIVREFSEQRASINIV